MFMRSYLARIQSKKECKDQESIQSSTTADLGYQWESDNFTIRHHNESQEVSPFPADAHKASINNLRTSDSLNEGLPIKMTREKFQRKWYFFFYEKDSRFNTRLIHKSRFLIGQVPIEKYELKSLFCYSSYRK